MGRSVHRQRAKKRSAGSAGPRIIKRYGNRKLYDTVRSEYINLDDVRDLVRSGEEVRVVDNRTGEDLTSVTFAQIIYEDEKRQNGFAGSTTFLRWLIQRRDEAIREFMRSMERGREALETMREATERRVQRFVEKTEDLLLAPQRQLDQLQQRIDQQMRQSVDLLARRPFQREIQRIEQSLRELEQKLARFRAGGALEAKPEKPQPPALRKPQATGPPVRTHLKLRPSHRRIPAS